MGTESTDTQAVDSATPCYRAMPDDGEPLTASWLWEHQTDYHFQHTSGKWIDLEFHASRDGCYARLSPNIGQGTLIDLFTRGDVRCLCFIFRIEFVRKA